MGIEMLSDLQNVRRVLGYAAMGVMVAPAVAQTAHDTVEVVCESAADTQSIKSLRQAVAALNRGLMPGEDLCRQGQREAHLLIQTMQERGERTEAPRAR